MIPSAKDHKRQVLGGEMVTIVGVSGSLRRQSFNTALLREAAALMPPESTLNQRTIHGIPLYNADDEAAQGLPAVVTP